MNRRANVVAQFAVETEIETCANIGAKPTATESKEPQISAVEGNGRAHPLLRIIDPEIDFEGKTDT